MDKHNKNNIYKVFSEGRIDSHSGIVSDRVLYQAMRILLIIFVLISSDVFASEPIKASLSYERNKRNGEVNTNNIGFNLSYDFTWKGQDFWSFNQAVHDNALYGKGFENAIGMGLKHHFIRGENKSISLSCGPLGFYSEGEWSGLFSCRPKFQYKEVYGTYFYQPKIGDWSNYISKGKIGWGNAYYKIEYRPGSDYKDKTVGIKKSWEIKL